MKKMFNDILFYCELTICYLDKTAYISKCQSNGYQINYDLAEYLVNASVVELDSGNWDTGERHFRLDIESNSILDRINFLKNKIDSSTPWFSSSKNKMLKDVLDIELQYKRIIKIKKLNNIYER